MKRILDIVVVLVTGILWAPLLVVIALIVRVVLGAPIFFAQERPGLGGRPFKLIKFRTMRGMTGSDAERLTRAGRVLRAWSLDELPELLNVLKGEMSLVGPRPLLMRYLNRYTPQQARRHEVLPGITGWAQVKGRNAISWEQKFEYDVWYVEHQGLRLDLKILWLTAWQVIARKGICGAGEATMGEFWGSSKVDGKKEVLKCESSNVQKL
jgi:lipopolysaccharide/colanic/teichoic acid biosynthesis glycosyltransferase